MTINHLGVSGGKDSTALLLWAVHESGYPRESIRATFCDTGNEAPQTLEFIAYLSESVHPIETIRPELDFYQLAKTKRRFPTAVARFCTMDLKLSPIRGHIRRLVQECDGDIVLHSGIRRAESYARSRQVEELVHDTYFDCPVRRPLLGWSIGDVWAIHARYGVHRNPLYDMGMSRVGCYPCVMCRKEDVGRIAMFDPERIAFIRSQEEAVSAVATGGGAAFFNASRVPTRFRTLPCVSAKTGEIIYLPTIDDVARWGLESPDVYQQDLDLDDIDGSGRSCPSALGVCE
jgi:3'-phosphoadenosine 5'-phosphosulfate sulfotransferase (PAPS reductase)/FAD synthetase